MRLLSPCRCWCTRGDRSEHGGGRSCTRTRAVPAVVRGDVAFALRDSQFHLEGPLGEEPGWRGFAQPRLQSKWSPLVSAAVLGLLITGWHMPLVFMPQFDLGFPDIATTVLVTFWYAWLFNRTGGSVLLPLIAHAPRALSILRACGSPEPDVDGVAWTWLIAWACLVLALLIFDRKSWRTAPESAIDRVPGRIA